MIRDYIMVDNLGVELRKENKNIYDKAVKNNTHHMGLAVVEARLFRP